MGTKKRGEQMEKRSSLFNLEEVSPSSSEKGKGKERGKSRSSRRSGKNKKTGRGDLFEQPKGVEVELWTDGSSLGNPGPGGWCAILIFKNGSRLRLQGREEFTTNNRMELRGVIEGVAKTPPGSKITVYSDSTYVVNGINDWLKKWVAKKFKGVKNRDLWEKLWSLMQEREVKGKWVKGHSHYELNKLCDLVARDQVDKIPLPAEGKERHYWET